jgi:glycosyltransferase EpsD
MKKKVLFTASIAKHLVRFHLPYLKWFKEQDYEVHIACEGDDEVPFTDKKWAVPFVRSPFSKGHIKAYKTLKRIIDTEEYSLIHCHTPMASIVTRLAAKEARIRGTKVLYTAHGFHFFNRGPFLNWLTYYPVEILCSYLADAIITINNEDYLRISKNGNAKCKYFLIPGVGVEKSKFSPVNEEVKQRIRRKNGFGNNDLLLIYAAEFIPRKNHEFLIKSAKELVDRIPNVKILFAGRGKLEGKLVQLSNKLGLNNKVIYFLGFRNDINEVFQMCDIGISASLQEGLGLNLIEEMMCGLPVVATEDRGHNEVINQNENGFLFPQGNKSQFRDYIEALTNDKNRSKMSKKAIIKADSFELLSSLNIMGSIYSELLASNESA